MLEFIREKGWSILNGDIKRDKEDNWTYPVGGRGNSVIDYILADEETRKEIEYMEVGDEIESDHHPLVMAWKEKEKKERREEEQAGECGIRYGGI